MRRRILALLGVFFFVAALPAAADTDAQKLATVRQMIEAWNTRNWQQVYDLFAADGVVFIERVDDFVYRGHHGAVPVVGVVEVEQGRVKAWREYYDRGQMLEAMGLKEDFDAAQRR